MQYVLTPSNRPAAHPDERAHYLHLPAGLAIVHPAYRTFSAGAGVPLSADEWVGKVSGRGGVSRAKRPLEHYPVAI